MLRNQKILATTTMKTKEFTNDEEEFFPLYSLESFVRQNPIQYSVSISLFNFSICSNNLSAEIRSCVIHIFFSSFASNQNRTVESVRFQTEINKNEKNMC